MRLITREILGSLKIYSRDPNYCLLINNTNKYNYGTAYFVCKPNHEKPHICITGRDFEEYSEEIRNFNFDSSKKYLEIGAGLGGVIPKLVNSLNGNLVHKPVVIDPANYGLMAEMLNLGLSEAKERNYSSVSIRKLESLIERAEFYSTSNNIELIPWTLIKSIKKFPNLKGSADVVIDHYAARYYPHVEFPTGMLDLYNVTRIIDCAKSLLNENGSFIG